MAITLTRTERASSLAWARDAFDGQVRAVPADGWQAPTPCRDWNVRALVNHLTVEQLWVPPLLAGLTIADMGTRLDGDQLGADPVGRWTAAARAARDAWSRPSAWTATPVLSFGPTPAAEYAFQLTADLLIHAWDLARALDVAGRSAPDRRSARSVGSRPEVVRWVHENLLTQIDAWRAAGIFAEPVSVADDADEWDRLLALAGRSPHWLPGHAST